MILVNRKSIYSLFPVRYTIWGYIGYTEYKAIYYRNLGRKEYF